MKQPRLLLVLALLATMAILLLTIQGPPTFVAYRGADTSSNDVVEDFDQLILYSQSVPVISSTKHPPTLSNVSNEVSKDGSSKSVSIIGTPHIDQVKEKFLRQQFKPTITQKEKSKFMEALEVLIDAFDSAGIKYYAFGGTLIGSWRHHDMVPWDDDIDIVVNDSDKNAVAKLKFANHTISTKDSFRYRLMCNDGTPSRGEPVFIWPFIDIIFFGDNGTHFHNMWPPKSKVHVYKKSDILPLKPRPFGKLTIYSPQKPLIIIKDATTICKTRDWSHRDIVPIKEIFTEDCKLLYSIYPFVIRNESGTDIENLYLNGKLLHSIRLQNP